MDGPICCESENRFARESECFGYSSKARSIERVPDVRSDEGAVGSVERMAFNTCLADRATTAGLSDLGNSVSHTSVMAWPPAC